MYCCVFAPGNLPILLDCAHRFSPLVEEHPDMVVFDIRGLETLHGPPDSIAGAIEREVGIRANIAIASGPKSYFWTVRERVLWLHTGVIDYQRYLRTPLGPWRHEPSCNAAR